MCLAVQISNKIYYRVVVTAPNIGTVAGGMPVLAAFSASNAAPRTAVTTHRRIHVIWGATL